MNIKCPSFCRFNQLSPDHPAVKMTILNITENNVPAERSYEDLLGEENDHDMDVFEDTDIDNDDLLEERPADTTLPPGWSREGSSIKSPAGELYKSRRHALVEMVNSGEWSEEEVSVMRSKMKHEGWEESDRIPRGWMMKEGVSDTQFLGLGGEFFENVKEAADFVEKYKKYFYQDDIEKIDNFQKPHLIHATSEDFKTEIEDKWIGNHPSVPAGWLFKCVGNFGKNNVNIRVKSPAGKCFYGRRPALKFMIEQNFPEEQIRDMRNCLEFDGWMQDETLPTNWLYKPSEGERYPTFIDSSGNFLRTREEAFRSLCQDEENLIMVKEFCQNRQPVYNARKGKGADDWITDHPSAPPGWKVKEISNGSKKVFKLLSPGRAWFPSHRMALKHMIEKNFSEDNIEIMKNCMKYAGWFSDPLLPERWLYKKHHQHSSEFLDDQGNYFRNPEAVVRHLKLNEGANHLPTFAEFCESQSKNREVGRIIDSSWTEGDQTVPPGWMVKGFNFGQNKSFRLLSPDGKIFNGRRPALKFMIDKNYPKEDVESMRICLKHDGWIEDSLLPTNWFFKTRKYHTIPLLDSSGNYYGNREEAFKHLNKIGDSATVDAIKVFFDNRNPVYNKGKDIDIKWIKDQPSVPSGWMVKEVLTGSSTVYKLLSPDRAYFPSYRIAYKHMIDKMYPEEEIEEMWDCMKYAGWLSDPLLPERWLYKKHHQHSSEFLDDQGNYFRNPEAVVRHLKQNAGVDHRTAFSKFCENQSKNREVDRKIDSSWKEGDQTVPSGWMVKEQNFGNNSKALKLLSPDGKIFQGRRAALKFMINNQYPDENVTELRNYMKYDGWLCDPLLPEKWLYKPHPSHSSEFLDEQGNYFRNPEAVLKHLQLKADTDTLQIIAKFRETQNRNNQKVGRKVDGSWTSGEESVPAGWMIKEHSFGKTKVFRLLSPEGQIFQGHRSALKFMIDKQSPEEEIQEMRNCMKHEGWLSDTLLPDHWLYKKHHHSYFQFIDDQGNFLKSTEAALKHLKLKGDTKKLAFIDKFTDAQSSDRKYSKKVNNGISMNRSKKRKELDSSWSQISSLPPGWMIKESHFGIKKVFKLLSPDGLTFQSKIQALKFMIDQKYPLDQIEATKNLLKSDEWELNPMLPEGWLCKKQKNNASKILTSTGEIFKSREGVMNFMKCNNFEDIHIRNIKEFEICSKRSNTKSTLSKSAYIRTKDDRWVAFDGEELSGWRHKPGQQKYLSPAGVYLNGRVELLKFMVNNNFSKEQVLAMKNVTRSIK